MTTVTNIEIAEFQRDGATVLRQVLPPEWIDRLRDGVESNRTAPSKWAHWCTSTDEAVGFWTDYVTWPGVPEYRQIVFESGLADIAARLMQSETVRFFHEHVLVKEPGAVEPTPWHHDQPYYSVNGDQNVTMWIALDEVPAETTMRFIAGSRKSNRWFIPRMFVDATPYAEEDGHYKWIPDLDAEIDDHRIVLWDVNPGDVIVFRYRAVHDAPGSPLPSRHRAVTLRWLGDDATWAERPWLVSPPFEPNGLAVGEALDDPRFPLVVGAQS